MSRRWPYFVLILSLIGCASAGHVRPNDPLDDYDPEAVAAGEVPDLGRVYRQMGLASVDSGLPFVGTTAFFASAKAERTIVMVSLSVPNRGLTFLRDGKNGRYQARYAVDLSLRQGEDVVARSTSTETIQVTTFQETKRIDESVIYQRHFQVPPGQYALVYHVRDIQAERREVGLEVPMTVPSMEKGSISTPVVVYEGAPRRRLSQVPSYVATPRASMTFGADSVATVYLEVRQPRTASLVLELRNDRSQLVTWRDTVRLPANDELASAIIHVPLSRADVGVFHLIVRRPGARDSVRDSVSASLFIGFGPDFPVVSFGEMVSYLRYFASPERLRALWHAPPESRGAQWIAFLGERGPDLGRGTSRSEALRDYFGRIREANQLFRMDAQPGWLSDRGAVFVGLGRPDMVYERQRDAAGSEAVDGRARYLVWDYNALHTQFVFVDEFDAGQWQLLPSSASSFRLIMSRIVAQ